MKNCIVYISNNNPKYINYVKNALKYARQNVNKSTKIYVLTWKFNYDFKDADQTICISDYIKTQIPDSCVNGFLYFQFIKFFMLEHQFFRENFNKIAVLDSDTVILNKGINSIFDIDLHGNFIGACENNRQQYYNEQIHANDKYYNAGVLVLDVDSIQNNYDSWSKTLSDMLNYAITAKPQFMEQDAMNMFMHITEIDRSYNSYKNTTPIVIRHFIGKNKKILDQMCKLLKFGR